MKNFENYLNHIDGSAKNGLTTHTYFLCEVEREHYYHVVVASNDYQEIVFKLFTPNGCMRDLKVLANFDGILYPFEPNNKIDLANPAIWVKRDEKQYHLVDYTYCVYQPESNNN